MRELQMIRELLVIAILSAVFGAMAVSVFAPEQFGKWLQKIDNGRYEYVDCDCTNPL